MSNGLTEPLGQSQVLNYMIGLSKHYKISILSLEKKFLFKDYHQLKKIKNICAESDIAWQYHFFSSSIPIFSTIINLLKLIFLTLKVLLPNLKETKLIHARSYLACYSALFIFKLTKTNYLFDMRGLWPEELISSGRIQRYSFTHKYLERVEKSCLYNANSVVTLTDTSKKYLIHKYENFPIKNFEVIPTCVDLEKFYFRYPISNEIRVGCVGTVMSGWFDINLLLRFFNAIFEIYQNPSFEIVTTDNINDVMEELFSNGHRNEFPIEIFKGDPDKMPDIISRHTFSVMFYKTNNISEIARSPTKMAEILACGRPIIANEGIGDVDDIIINQNVGLILRNDDILNTDKLSNSLNKILSDKSLSNRCAAAVRKNFSIDYGVKKYKEIYELF
tara:strand:- start:17358 stop:18527 length:1170 start_codon:yes stop_codon:yes gene_type:complete